MARKKTENIEIVEATEEMTEDIETTDNEDAYEGGSDEQEKEEFLEDHEIDAMNAEDDLNELSREEPEEDPAPMIIDKVIDGPWRIRCPFFSYQDEKEAAEGLEINCTYHGIISLQLAHDSLEDVMDSMQRFCFGNFSECENYKEIYDSMQELEGYDDLKTCGYCCNASNNKEDLRRPNAEDAHEKCHCMQDGVDRFRFTSVSKAQENGCKWFNKYLDCAQEPSMVPAPSMNEVAELRTPDVIASEINAIKTQTMKTVLINSITIGGKLTEAKELVGHGNWGTWLANEVNYSQDTAENLMKLFREYGPSQLNLFGSIKSETFRNLGYSQALALCAIPADEREGFVQGNDVGKMSIRQLQREVEQYKAKAQEAESRANNLDWKARNGDYYQKKVSELSSENWNLRNEIRKTTGSEPERIEVMSRDAKDFITNMIDNFFENINVGLPDKKTVQIYVDAYKGRSEPDGIIDYIVDLVENLREIVGWMKELAPDCYDWTELDWCGYGSEETDSGDGDE